MFSNRDEAFLAALADAGQVLLGQMQVGEAHADELGDAQARGVQQLDHRAIAQAQRSRHVGLRDERVHILER